MMIKSALLFFLLPAIHGFTPSSRFLQQDEKDPWPSRVLFVRHVQSEANANHSKDYRDTPVTQLGFNQTMEIKTNLSHYQPAELIVISPMRRTLITAYYGLHDWIRTAKVLLNQDVRERGADYQQNWGTETFKWNETLPEDAYEFYHSLPNFGYVQYHSRLF